MDGNADGTLERSHLLISIPGLCISALEFEIGLRPCDFVGLCGRLQG